MKKIYLAGGCFWGVEHFLSLIEGVTKTTVGYANSDILSPSYEDLKAHRSAASETVETEYDEEKISLEEILNSFLLYKGKRINNGVAESINSVVSLILYNTKGIRNHERRRKRIMYCVNKEGFLLR